MFWAHVLTASLGKEFDSRYGFLITIYFAGNCSSHMQYLDLFSLFDGRFPTSVLCGSEAVRFESCIISSTTAIFHMMEGVNVIDFFVE